MIINHNMASLNTYRQMSINEKNTSNSLAKLSSGLRINKAGDDAAGLAISEKMRGQIRGLDQASSNAQDGISMIQTAEGALNETHSILQRMKELATQAANDTNTSSDRGEIQKEINQLTSEINRIGNTTEFNTQKLLDGGGSKGTSLSVVTATMGGKAGNVSSVSTITDSKTGKSSMTIQFSATQSFTIEASTVGTDLNGINFQFTATNAAGKGVVKAGSTVTVSYDSTADTAATIQTLINTSGLVTSPVKVTLTNPTTGAANAGAVGANLGGLSKVMAGGETAETRGVYSIDVTQAFVKQGDTFSLKVPSAATPSSFTLVTLTATNTGAAADQFNIGGVASRLSAADQAASMRDALVNDAKINGIYDVSVSGTKIIFTEKSGQTQGMAIAKQAQTSTAQAGKMSYTQSAQQMITTGGKFQVDGVDIRVVDGSGADDTADIAAGRAILYNSADTTTTQMNKLATAITQNNQLNSNYNASDAAGTLTLTQVNGKERSTAVILTGFDKAGNGFEAKFQIGANTAQSMTVDISDMRSQALKISGIVSGNTIVASNGAQATLRASQEVTNGTDNTNVEYSLDVSDHDKATAAISVLDDAIQSVSAERSKLGAYQNRLEHTISNLGTSSENLTAAESRIRDVDMAKEMMNFQKNNILQQAAQAMLAQANQQPQGVLQLLR